MSFFRYSLFESSRENAFQSFLHQQTTCKAPRSSQCPSLLASKLSAKVQNRRKHRRKLAPMSRRGESLTKPMAIPARQKHAFPRSRTGFFKKKGKRLCRRRHTTPRELYQAIAEDRTTPPRESRRSSAPNATGITVATIFLFITRNYSEASPAPQIAEKLVGGQRGRFCDEKKCIASLIDLERLRSLLAQQLDREYARGQAPPSPRGSGPILYESSKCDSCSPAKFKNVWINCSWNPRTWCCSASWLRG